MMTLNNMDKGFEAYNLYLSLRAHFHGGTGKNFDITKGYKKVRTSYETYKNNFDKDNNINCFQKCKDCLVCYTFNNVKTIIEKTK